MIGNSGIRYEHTPPLQLHQVLPTLAPGEGYYRTAATSPFQTVQVDTGGTPGTSGGGSIVTGRSGVAFVRAMQNAASHEVIIPSSGNVNVISSASPISAEIPRFCKEDYDSDDELGRADIAFSMDGGEAITITVTVCVCRIFQTTKNFLEVVKEAVL